MDASRRCSGEEPLDELSIRECLMAASYGGNQTVLTSIVGLRCGSFGLFLVDDEELLAVDR